MKARSNKVCLLFATVVLGVLASFAHAGPGPHSFETLRTESQFKQLNAGNKVLYVCNQCQSATEKTIDSTDQAMDHCKEGATVTCPSCKATVKVTKRSNPNRKSPGAVREVVYVNEKGEECFFVAKVDEEK